MNPVRTFVMCSALLLAMGCGSESEPTNEASPVDLNRDVGVLQKTLSVGHHAKEQTRVVPVQTVPKEGFLADCTPGEVRVDVPYCTPAAVEPGLCRRVCSADGSRWVTDCSTIARSGVPITLNANDPRFAHFVGAPDGSSWEIPSGYSTNGTMIYGEMQLAPGNYSFDFYGWGRGVRDSWTAAQMHYEIEVLGRYKYIDKGERGDIHRTIDVTIPPGCPTVYLSVVWNGGHSVRMDSIDVSPW